MVTIRSSLGMNEDSTLSVVVLPEPVPPETKTFRRASTQAFRKSNISGVAVPKRMRSSTVNGEAANLRMVMTGPTRLSGGMMALTREPSVRRASTIGLDSSMRRPIGRDDAVDDAHDVVVVLEGEVGQLEPAAALDVDLAGPVDHDLGDGLVAQQRLQRAEADDLVGDLLQHAHPLGAGEREALLVDRDAEDLLDLPPYLDLVGEVELGVEVGDDALLDAVLGVAEGLAHRHLRDDTLGHRRRGRAHGAGSAGGRPAPGDGLAPDGSAGGGAGPVTGRLRRLARALSIRFSSDISTSP